MSLQNLPNLISALRILLVIPVAWALLENQFALALALFAAAGISDGLDGFLAKHYHWESRLGSILDPIADKLLLVVSFAVLAWLSLLPIWLLWMVLARDMLIVAGGLLYHYLVGRFELVPLWSSKFNTLAQILLVLVVMINHIDWLDLSLIVEQGIWLVFASVLYSGCEYIFVWGRKAWRQLNA